MGVEFCRKFFCFYWDDHMVFLLQFVNMVYWLIVHWLVWYIDWFVYIEESLHSWDKLHLIMVYDPFNVLMDSVCWYFVEEFCIYVHQWYWPVVFFLCDIFVWFWYQGDGGLVGWVWECSSLCYILEEFKKDRCKLFSKCFIEFSCKAICPLHACCCALLRGSEASPLPPPLSISEGAS